jgi:hypothetical protein
MGRDTYQTVSPMQSLIFVNIVRQYFGPGLVFTLIPCADPAFWSPLFAYADLYRLKEADFEVGGKEYGVYGHNWRAVPPIQWLNVLADREISMNHKLAEPPPAISPVLVLSDVEFTSAINDALKNFTRTDQLRKNPLLQSRFVVDQAGTSLGSAARATSARSAGRATSN